MPVVGGVEAIQLFDTSFPDARLIVLTTYDGDEDITDRYKPEPEVIC